MPPSTMPPASPSSPFGPRGPVAADLSSGRRSLATYEKVVAQYPKSGYCDDALLAAGAALRGDGPPIQASLATVRTPSRPTPSSSPNTRAAVTPRPRSIASFEIAQASGDRKAMNEAARDYIEACPDGAHLAEGEGRTPQERPRPARGPSFASPSGSRAGLRRPDLERRLLHPHRHRPREEGRDSRRTHRQPGSPLRRPHGDPYSSQPREARPLRGRRAPRAGAHCPEPPDVVRIVLDFKSVEGHSVFFLADPVRLVIDVRGRPAPPTARAEPPSEGSSSRSAASQSTALRIPSEGTSPKVTASGTTALSQTTPTGTTAGPRNPLLPLDWPEGVPPNEGFRPAGAPQESKTKEPARKVNGDRPPNAGAESPTKASRPLPQHPVSGMASAPPAPPPAPPVVASAAVIEFSPLPPSKPGRACDEDHRSLTFGGVEVRAVLFEVRSGTSTPTARIRERLDACHHVG